MHSRRSFLPLLAAPLVALGKAWAGAPAMRITALETVYWHARDDAPFWPHWTWVKIHTDSGAYRVSARPIRAIAAEARRCTRTSAPLLLGHDPGDIERIWADLYRNFRFSGRRRRGNPRLERDRSGAVGPARQHAQRAGLPADRRQANPRVRPLQHVLPSSTTSTKSRTSIMRELIDRYGIRAIKIWPFDGAALRATSTVHHAGARSTRRCSRYEFCAIASACRYRDRDGVPLACGT